MELQLLKDIVIVLGISVLIILAFQKLRIPAIIGFLVTGAVAGPYGLSLIQAIHEVELMAEIGVIFLLFVIGIEFSLRGLASIKNTVVIGGAIQVFGTIAVIALCAYLLGFQLNSALFLGFLLSLSSTAIVLKLLQEKGEITTPHGRTATAILIFQDIIVVPMMLLTPLLSGASTDLFNTILWLLIKVVAIILVVILMARYLVPNILNLVVKTKIRELFILTVIAFCFATAWLTSAAGLSLALGAFFAGLIISESDFSHQATANILPFREIFVSFFFVSVGMLLNLRFFLENIGIILLITVGVMLIKGLVIAAAVFALKYPVRTILISSISLFQVGEFAFLLSATGMEYNLLSVDTYQYFLATSILSMGATPLLVNYAHNISDFLIKTSLPRQVRQRLSRYAKSKATTSEQQTSYKDHLIIIGYGINGENVAKAARNANIQYVIIELDPTIFGKAKFNNEPVVYGDASDEVILKHVHIQEARVVVVAISDPVATKQIIRSVRRFTQTAFLIVRTRYIREIEENLKLGADQVIPEEFETSIEIFTRVLKEYLVPNAEIQQFINQIRSHNYEMLRKISGLETPPEKISLTIPDMEIATIRVRQGSNKIVGKTIRDSDLRGNYGVTVLTINRNGRFISRVTPEMTIEQDDIVYLFGHPDNIAQINELLQLN